ncbi:MAG: hypothetical protein ACI9SP_002247 [Arenicella sp.]
MLCKDGKGVVRGDRATILRTEGLPGALGRNGQPDDPVNVVTDNHHTTIAFIIRANTSSGVKHWPVAQDFLIGTNALGEKDYVIYRALEQGGSTANIVRALRHIAEGFVSLEGVEVVSISQHENNRFEWPCDNHPEVRSDQTRVNYMEAIARLKSKGVTVVTATANSTIYPQSPGNRLFDNYEMPFPACLSTTVAVGGLSNQGVAQGAISPGTDFLVNYHYPDLLGGPEQWGTSLATPKIASYVAELLTVNPVLNRNQVLTALRSAATSHVGSRIYEDGAFRVNYTIPLANFAAARASVIDNFWKDLIPALLGQVDDTQYGWNYGSSIHENGVLSYFESVPLQQNKVFNSNREIDLTAKTSQSTSSNEQVLRFSFRAFDINTVDEVEVLVNDKFYGYLKTTGVNQLGATQSVCISGADLTTNGTRNEVKLKLKNARETWGVQNLKIEVGTADSSCLKEPPTFVDLPVNDDRLAGSSTAYGNAYQRVKVDQVPFSFNFSTANSGLPSPSIFHSNGMHRDIRIKFTSKSGDASANSTILRVNGSQVLQTESFSGANERSYDYIVNRNLLFGGSNTVDFGPGTAGANSIWGVRGISIEYIEPITLSLGSIDFTRYGYNQTPQRYTGMRVNFTLDSIQDNYVFSAQGWGIDRADEAQVFINGSPLGFLSIGSSNGLGAKNSFIVSASLLLQGANQIEFVQRRPGPSWQGPMAEQWGVENMKFSDSLDIMITPVILMLLDDD